MSATTARLFLVFSLFLNFEIDAQDLTELVFKGIPNISNGDIAWGDYDGDGDQDLLISGWDGSGPFTRLYKTEGDYYRVIKIINDDLWDGDIGFIDFNGDGLLDIYLSGINPIGEKAIYLLKGIGNDKFESIPLAMDGINNSYFLWNDFNQDGLLDLLVAGTMDNDKPVTRILYNAKKSFVSSGIKLIQVDLAAALIINDQGNNSLYITGRGSSKEPVSVVYFIGENGEITEINDPFQGKYPILDFSYPVSLKSRVEWFDYDGDGDLDVLFVSNENGINKTEINENLNFISFRPVLDLPFSGTATDFLTGDIDLDGNVDIIELSSFQSPDQNESSYFKSTVYSYINGEFIKRYEISHDWEVPEIALSYMLEDLNGDLYPDLVISPNSNAFGNVNFTQVHYNNEGILGAEIELKDTNNKWSYLGIITIGDLNGDGYNDLLADRSILINQIDGAVEKGDFLDLYDDLNNSPLLYSALFPNGILDFNGDGLNDIITKGDNNKLLAVENKGNNIFEASDIHFGINDLNIREISSVDYIDLNSDTLKDIIVSASYENGKILKFYRNTGQNAFTEVNLINPLLLEVLLNADDLDFKFININNDDLIDLQVIYSEGATVFNTLLINQGNFNMGSFNVYSASYGGYFENVRFSDQSVNSILETGKSNTGYIFRITKANNDASREDIISFDNTILDAKIETGDINNDGHLDIIASILYETGVENKLFISDLNYKFDTINLPLDYFASLAITDINNDGLLDISAVSKDNVNPRLTVLKNNSIGINDAPDPPGNLNVVVQQNIVKLKWDNGVDDLTGANELTYSHRLYKDGVSIAADGQGLTTLFFDRGQLNYKRDISFNLDSGSYEFQIQSVDNSFQRSPLSSIQFQIEAVKETDFFTKLDLPISDRTSGGSVKWADFNNDGQLDFITALNGITLFIQDRGVFKEIKLDIKGTTFTNASIRCGDLDNDNDIDLLIVGENKTSILMNEGNLTFNNIDISYLSIPAFDFIVNVEFADFNGDDLLDFYILGFAGFGKNFSFYYNTGDSKFKNVDLGFGEFLGYEFQFVDLTNDGLLDVYLEKLANDSFNYEIYENKGNLEFELLTSGLAASGVDFGDYDMDGDVDIIDSNGAILRNDKDIFTFLPDLITTTLTVFETRWSPKFVDLDSDGDLDVHYRTSKGVAKFFINTGNDQFEESDIYMNDLLFTDSDYGDFDHDGDLDLIATSYEILSVSIPELVLYENNTNPTIKPIKKPENLMFEKSDNGESTFSWTGDTGYSYNIFVKSGDKYVIAPSSTEEGYRMLPIIGNAFHSNSKTIQILSEGDIIWGVQSINNSGYASDFQIDTIKINNFEKTFSMAIGSISTLDVIDIDNDADRDIFVYDDDFGHYMLINDGQGNFSQRNLNLGGLFITTSDWGDFDNDNDLDLAITGGKYNNATGQYENKFFIFENLGNLNLKAIAFQGKGINRFVDIFNGTDIRKSIQWFDFDNDGDLDVILGGSIDTSYNGFFDTASGVTIIYENLGGGKFEETSLGLPFKKGVNNIFSLGDFDGDGSVDIAQFYSGSETGGAILHNKDGKFELYENFGIKTSVGQIGVEWLDIDLDDDLDLFLNGEVYENTSGVLNFLFNDINLGKSIDLNLDRQIDGYSEINYINQTTINTNFVSINRGNTNFYDIDIMELSHPEQLRILSCELLYNERFADLITVDLDSLYLMKNTNSGLGNLDLSSPEIIGTELDGDMVILRWNPVHNSGNTFNVYIRNETETIVSAQSLESGFRLMSSQGNAYMNDFYKLIKDLPDDEYFWSVQSIGPNYQGGVFAPENSFVICKEFSEITIDFQVPNAGVGAQIKFETALLTDEGLKYLWNFGDGLTSDEIAPIHVYQSEGEFRITLQIENYLGCNNSIEKFIEIENGLQVKIATVITPNRDGSNDFLYIENIERYPDNQIWVYAPSGNLIYHTKGYNNDWYGTFKQNPLDPGTYLCVLKVNQFATEIKQTFTVIR